MNLQEYFLELADIEALSEEMFENFSKSCSEKLKPVVLALAKEEAKHLELMVELSGDDRYKEKKMNEEIALVLKQQIDHIKINGEKLDMNCEKDFFQFALQIEKNSINIYTAQLSAFENDSNALIMFETIIKEERKHMLYILDRLYKLR
ncbi:hypothetical protein [Acetobacterium sp.]|uniref:hypothetical protein n=1 Tax=Acetobacterium sp. TaxID=1872094 RepID=UPI002F417ADE